MAKTFYEVKAPTFYEVKATSFYEVKAFWPFQVRIINSMLNQNTILHDQVSSKFE